MLFYLVLLNTFFSLLRFRNTFSVLICLLLFFGVVLRWFTTIYHGQSGFLTFDYLVADNVALLLTYLTVFVLITAFLSHDFNNNGASWGVFSLLFACCVVVFSAADYIILYVAFELSLIPIIYSILKWGSYPDRGVSSLIILIFTSAFTFPLGVLILGLLPWYTQSMCCAIFGSALPSFVGLWLVLSFSVKLPVYGLHFWLPMAHVEAPTFGSMILAGVLLKLGGCGLLRCLPLLAGDACVGLRDYFSVYLLLSLVLSSILCLAQSDFKRLVAYSSVVHMTLILLLIAVPSPLAISSTLILLLFHGLSSPLLFYMVGVAYSLFSTRELAFMRGTLKSSLLISFFSVLTFLVNIPVPPLPSFLAEVLSFLSIWDTSLVVPCVIFATLLLVLSYNLLWFSSISYGPYSGTYSIPCQVRIGLIISAYFGFLLVLTVLIPLFST